MISKIPVHNFPTPARLAQNFNKWLEVSSSLANGHFCTSAGSHTKNWCSGDTFLVVWKARSFGSGHGRPRRTDWTGVVDVRTVSDVGSAAAPGPREVGPSAPCSAGTTGKDLFQRDSFMSDLCRWRADDQTSLLPGADLGSCGAATEPDAEFSVTDVWQVVWNTRVFQCTRWGRKISEPHAAGGGSNGRQFVP